MTVIVILLQEKAQLEVVHRSWKTAWALVSLEANDDGWLVPWIVTVETVACRGGSVLPIFWKRQKNDSVISGYSLIVQNSEWCGIHRPCWAMQLMGHHGYLQVDWRETTKNERKCSSSRHSTCKYHSQSSNTLVTPYEYLCLWADASTGPPGPTFEKSSKRKKPIWPPRWTFDAPLSYAQFSSLHEW